MKLKLILFLFAIHGICYAAQPSRKIAMTQKTAPFAKWIAENPDEASVLNIFPSFREPTVMSLNNGVRERVDMKIQIYLLKTQSTLLKSPDKMNLASMISLENLQQLDPESLALRKISAADTMPVVAGNSKINNFKWCNAKLDLPAIVLPSYEVSQAHMARPEPPWCKATPNSICIESCHLFPEGSTLQSIVAGYNGMKNLVSNNQRYKSPGKDFGVATQSEIRYFANEVNYGIKIPMSRLTGVKTPVNGILEINTFYFNQILVFGKIIFVLQPNPTDAKKTILTSLSLYGINAHNWNHSIYGGNLQSLLQGRSVGINSSSGIFSGLPQFTRSTVNAISDVLEK